ncbi:leukocyte immunoglobulin-like receptor subfamily A member 6 isoform X2 [Sminthopsis crassicaudata]|uniref:leukocyte immunoglobulin-like receptor subfamily A member 6 isoform X2 n=2 Tax=Sminthopsis crassicaudata TaxID=9301 RepID=UPI003D6932E5
MRARRTLTPGAGPRGGVTTTSRSQPSHPTLNSPSWEEPVSPATSCPEHPGGGMEPRLLLLLCLNFRTPGPELRIRPHNILPVGSPVTISCYTPMIADYFRLIRMDYLEEDIGGEEVPSIYPGHEVHMYHPSIRPEHGGRYLCQYRVTDIWSFPSPHLDLVISGFYTSPRLVITPTKVKVGGSVNIKCYPGRDVLIIWLVIKGVSDFRSYVASGIELILDRNVHNLGPEDSGQYTCYGYNATDQHLWSLPSNVVTITVGENAAAAPRTGRWTQVSLALLALLLLQSRWSVGLPPPGRASAWTPSPPPTPAE